LGDRDKRDRMLVELLHQLREICQRSGQPVHLVDDDDIDLPAAEVAKQLLQGRAVQRGPGQSAIIVPCPDQPPALVGLALDIGLASLSLCVERIELEVEIMFGRFAGVDCAAEKFFGRLWPHWPFPA
jgi:hypothetical protein